MLFFLNRKTEKERKKEKEIERGHLRGYITEMIDGPLCIVKLQHSTYQNSAA